MAEQKDELRDLDGDDGLQRRDKDSAATKELSERYKKRVTMVKNGKRASDNGELMKAINFYTKYLQTISDAYKVPEKDLTPKVFDKKADAAELLLISQVYWDLACIFDLNPKLKKNMNECLKKFMIFSINMPHQHLSAKLLDNYIEKGRARNRAEFKEVYLKIAVESDKCYVATHLYGNHHQVTYLLREFKKDLLQFSWGEKFVHAYYKHSPTLISYSQKNKFLSLLTKLLCKYPLYIFARLYALTSSLFR